VRSAGGIARQALRVFNDVALVHALIAGPGDSKPEQQCALLIPAVWLNFVSWTGYWQFDSLGIHNPVKGLGLDHVAVELLLGTQGLSSRSFYPSSFRFYGLYIATDANEGAADRTRSVKCQCHGRNRPVDEKDSIKIPQLSR
jgi:hypothetical protein